MMHDLDRELTRLTRALRLHRAIIGGSWGIIVAMTFSICGAIAARITPLWHREVIFVTALWGLGASALIGIIVGYSWIPQLPQRLRHLDQHLQLSDRLTTAWELRMGRIATTPELLQFQTTETLSTLRTVHPELRFPVRPTRPMCVAMLLLVSTLLLLIWLPNPQEATLAQLTMQQQAVEAAIKQVEALQSTLTENPTLDKTQQETARQLLEDVLAELRDPNSTPMSRQTALSNAERALAALQDYEVNARTQALAEAQPLSKEREVKDLVKAMEQEALGDAAALLRDTYDPQTGDNAIPEAQLTLADTLTQIADILQEEDPTLATQFQEIAEAIYNADNSAAEKAIQQAAETLEAMAEDNAANQSLEQGQAALQQTRKQLGDAQTLAMGQAADNNSDTPWHRTQGDTPPEQQPNLAGGSGEQDGSGGGTGETGNMGSSAAYNSDITARLEGTGDLITLPRPEALGEANPTTGETAPSQVTGRTVPYQEVYATYADTVEAALSQKAYPPALRAYVRDYFSSLGE